MPVAGPAGHHEVCVPHGSAVDKISAVVDKADTCFLVTRGGVRPMGVRKCAEDGVLWFLSDKHSHKNAEIEVNLEV